MLSNAYFLARFRFDTAENEPAKNLQNFENAFSKNAFFENAFFENEITDFEGPGGTARRGAAEEGPRPVPFGGSGA